jgi:hypothetical protein
MSLIRSEKGEIVDSIREEVEVWRKKAESKESEKRRLDSEITRLTLDNAELGRRIGSDHSVDERSGSAARERRTRLAALMVSGETSEEQWRKQQREFSVQLHRLNETIEKAANERRMLQMQCDSLEQRIGLMTKAGQLECKTHSQRQAEITEMDLQRAKEEIAEREEEGKRPPKKGRFARHTPDPALLEFRARKTSEANAETPEEQPVAKPAGNPVAWVKRQGGRALKSPMGQERAPDGIPPLSESNAVAPTAQKRENGRQNEHTKPAAAKRWKGKESVVPAIGRQKGAPDADAPASGRVQSRRAKKNGVQMAPVVPRLVEKRRDGDEDDDPSHRLMEGASRVGEMASPREQPSKPEDSTVEMESSNSVETQEEKKSVPSAAGRAGTLDDEGEANDGKVVIPMKEDSETDEPDVGEKSMFAQVLGEREQNPSEPGSFASLIVDELNDE